MSLYLGIVEYQCLHVLQAIHVHSYTFLKLELAIICHRESKIVGDFLCQLADHVVTVDVTVELMPYVLRTRSCTSYSSQQ